MAGSRERRYVTDVRHEEAQEGSHRQHATAGARHEREEHHDRVSLRLHRQVQVQRRYDIHGVHINNNNAIVY